jgi:hypothetical protein
MWQLLESCCVAAALAAVSWQITGQSGHILMKLVRAANPCYCSTVCKRRVITGSCRASEGVAGLLVWCVCWLVLCSVLLQQRFDLCYGDTAVLAAAAAAATAAAAAAATTSNSCCFVQTQQATLHDH